MENSEPIFMQQCATRREENCSKIYLEYSSGIKPIIKVKNAINRYVERVEQYKKISIQFDFNPMMHY